MEEPQKDVRVHYSTINALTGRFQTYCISQASHRHLPLFPSTGVVKLRKPLSASDENSIVAFLGRDAVMHHCLPHIVPEGEWHVYAEMSTGRPPRAYLLLITRRPQTWPEVQAALRLAHRKFEENERHFARMNHSDQYNADSDCL